MIPNRHNYQDYQLWLTRPAPPGMVVIYYVVQPDFASKFQTVRDSRFTSLDLSAAVKFAKEWHGYVQRAYAVRIGNAVHITDTRPFKLADPQSIERGTQFWPWPRSRFLAARRRKIQKGVSRSE